MEAYLIVVLAVILIEVSFLVFDGRRRLSKKISERLVFIDTSVLIDGRILPVVRSGFIRDKLIIPRCVVGELQFMADNADSEKRSRARYGLDQIIELQKVNDVKVEMLHDDSFSNLEVDEQLLRLAKKYHGSICTIDYNLNKVAAVEGVFVLNINDLAMSLRMAYLPGEKIVMELTDKGQEQHQAVGHLPDGTMVVVENANGLVGKSAEVEFIRSLQTAAGKMMFAKLVVDGRKQNDENSKKSTAKDIRMKDNTKTKKYSKLKSNTRQQSKSKHSSHEQGFIDLINHQ